MPTQCSADLFGFAPVERRRVEAAFDGGAVTSDAGALLLGATDRAIKLVGRLAGCFTDGRRSDLIEHDVATLVSQRVFGIALGYEDLVDHDQLRHDPAMAVLAGKLEARRADCAPLAGKSTLNRLEQRLSARSATARSPMIRRRSSVCWSISSSTRIACRPSGWCSTWTQPTTHCTATRRAGSSTVTMAATVICHSTSFAAGTCLRPSSDVRTSTPRPARLQRSSGSSGRSAPAGRGSVSCCVPTAALPARC